MFWRAQQNLAAQHDQLPLNGKNSALRSRCPGPGPSFPSPQAGFSMSFSSASCLVSLPSLSPVVSFKKFFFLFPRIQPQRGEAACGRYYCQGWCQASQWSPWEVPWAGPPIVDIITCLRIMDGSPPGSSVHRILCARILERATIPFSRGSSPPRNRT